MPRLELSMNCKKALTVHLGEPAGREVADLLQRMAERIERLERSKVDVMPVVSDRATAFAKRDRLRKGA